MSSAEADHSHLVQSSPAFPYQAHRCQSSAVTTTDASNKRQQQPDSTSSTSTLATTVTANGNFDLYPTYTVERELLETEFMQYHDAPVTRTASTAAKPCQEYSYEFYLITFELGKPLSGDSLNLPVTGIDDGFHLFAQPHSGSQVDQESQIKMIQVKEMMQDNDLKNSKSKDKGSRSRSQSMNDQSHYKQDKTKTRQSINVKNHILNVIGGTEECEERDLNIGGDC
ncbi:hypothetical protein Tco_0818701 [Tanacetum coccineum]